MKVGVATVRELYGVMAAEGAVGGFVVASGNSPKRPSALLKVGRLSWFRQIQCFAWFRKPGHRSANVITCRESKLPEVWKLNGSADSKTR